MMRIVGASSVPSTDGRAFNGWKGGRTHSRPQPKRIKSKEKKENAFFVRVCHTSVRMHAFPLQILAHSNAIILIHPIITSRSMIPFPEDSLF